MPVKPRPEKKIREDNENLAMGMSIRSRDGKTMKRADSEEPTREVERRIREAEDKK